MVNPLWWKLCTYTQCGNYTQRDGHRYKHTYKHMDRNEWMNNGQIENSIDEMITANFLICIIRMCSILLLNGRSVVQKKFADLLNMSIMWMMEMMKTQWLKRKWIECIFHIPVELIGNGEKLLDPFHSSHLPLHWIIRNIRSFVISCELSQAHLTYTWTGKHARVCVCVYELNMKKWWKCMKMSG